MADQPEDDGSRSLVRATGSGIADMRLPAGSGSLPATGASLRDLGALTGLRRLGLLQGQLEPGMTGCELPVQTGDEMFLQILAGSGQLECDGQRVSVAAGDLLSLAHPDSRPILRNTGDEPLTWLMGRHAMD